MTPQISQIKVKKCVCQKLISVLYINQNLLFFCLAYRIEPSFMYTDCFKITHPKQYVSGNISTIATYLMQMLHIQMYNFCNTWSTLKINQHFVTRDPSD